MSGARGAEPVRGIVKRALAKLAGDFSTAMIMGAWLAALSHGGRWRDSLPVFGVVALIYLALALAGAALEQAGRGPGRDLLRRSVVDLYSKLWLVVWIVQPDITGAATAGETWAWGLWAIGICVAGVLSAIAIEVAVVAGLTRLRGAAGPPQPLAPLPRVLVRHLRWWWQMLWLALLFLLLLLPPPALTGPVTWQAALRLLLLLGLFMAVPLIVDLAETSRALRSGAAAGPEPGRGGPGGAAP